MQMLKESLISEEKRKQFDEDGYFVLESILDKSVVEALRNCIDKEKEKIHKKMELEKTNKVGLSHKGRRYFIGRAYDNHKAMYEHVNSELMREICLATIGGSAYLFCEQFVVKSARNGNLPGMSFSWHQDSGYVPHTFPFYVSCWTALDDMSDENGTIRVLPYQRAGGKKAFKHEQNLESNDMIGYEGDDPGIVVEVPVGSVVVFSSYTLHCSGENKSNADRRSYLTQYSSEQIMDKDNKCFHNRAVPFLKDDKIISPEWRT